MRVDRIRGVFWELWAELTNRWKQVKKDPDFVFGKGQDEAQKQLESLLMHQVKVSSRVDY